MKGQVERLVKMANQIAHNFSHWGTRELAVSKTAEHLQKFWTPDMLHQLMAYGRQGGEGLSPILREALAVFEEQTETGETHP